MQSKFILGLSRLFLVVFLGLACAPTSLIAQFVPTETPSSPIAPTTAPTLPIPVTGGAAPKSTEHTVQVDSLWVTLGTPTTGGTSSVQVTVRPAPQSGELRVGFFEQEVGGTGPQWHAAGWEAVLMATILRGVDPAEHEFSISVGGRIDGPSAGGLMTIAILAALQGDTPRVDATMTGTINPDGTIGPVGGIPHKLEGAARKGKKLVLIPIGERFSLDYNTNQMVDVVQVGKNLGLDVREVSNVYAAYQLIVGKPLARPVAAITTPQFPPAAFDRLKARERQWYSQYLKQRSQFLTLSSPIQEYLKSYLDEADQAASKADNDLGQGLAAVAYFMMSDGATKLARANIKGDMISRFRANGLQKTTDYLKSTQTV